jgi:hypothetical protein
MTNKEAIKADLDALDREFSLPNECVGVFGSATATESPEDVDVFIHTADASTASKRISALRLASTVMGIDVNDYRDRTPEPGRHPPLHVVVVTADEAEERLKARNEIYHRAAGWGLR